MWNAAGTSDFTLTLRDSASNVLESWTANAPPTSSFTPVVEVDSASHPLLLQGQTYTLTADAAPTTWDAWEDFNDTFISGKSGFRVEGTAAAVPEPSTLALAGVGGLGLIGYAWRRGMRRHAA